MLAATIAGGVGPAGANADCGTISFSFEGTRLLNDGISHQAGPFSITLPAGTYDVVMRSSDSHSTQDGQIDQEAERWWFSLDSGWHSSATDDLPDELDANVTAMAGQVIPASTSITLHHLGQGGINSVNPVCVGFTQTGELPGDPADPNGDTPDPDDDPARAIPDPGTPDGGIPDRAIPDDDGDDPGPGDNPGGADDTPGPNDDPDRAIPDDGNPDPNNPDDLDRGDPGDPGLTPDQPVVPELAITGSGVLTIRLVGAALILFQVGFLLLLADRQRTA